MVLNDAERTLLFEVLNEVKPYMSETDEVEGIIREQSGSASTMSDLIGRLQNEHDRTSVSVLRTDLRIYIGRLRKHIRG
jgi:hypothetical protein